MDENNPAVSNRLAVPPAALELVEKDPAYLRSLSRKMLMVQMVKLHEALRDPGVTIAQRLSASEFFAKTGDVAPKPNAAQGGPGGLNPAFSVVINLGDAAPSKKVVEASATVLELSDGNSTSESGS